jgi:polyferredoxin
MKEFMGQVRCWIGLHKWVKGAGWITVAPSIQIHYDGLRCVRCLRCKDAPDIIEQSGSGEGGGK